MEQTSEHVYYIADENKLSVVSEYTHKRFSKWIISKHCGRVGDFYWEYKTEEEIVTDFLNRFEKDIIYLGEL
jgi:hypothetical protein